MPKTITRLKVNGGWNDLERKVPLADVGTFLFESRAGELWSFASAAFLQIAFAPVLIGSAQEIPMSKVEEDEVLRRKASWLIRKHFERHLKGFEDDGLMIEEAKRGASKRAYFQSNRGRDRIFTYDSPSRKNIKRGVAKMRGDDTKAYFECEGFGFEVVRFGSTWGVRVKPFYMFTKQDGKTPLPGYMRTSRSTRRIKFDRNASVESDLVFWGRFLSSGEQTINIGGEHAPDLLLDGDFFTVDVQEGGLLNNELVVKDKRTA